MPSKTDFIGTLFYGDDLVELRLVEQWEWAGKQKTAVRKIYTVPASDLAPAAVEELASICGSNKQRPVHVFCGVCPRSGAGGKSADIPLARCVWADLDYVKPADAVAVAKKKKLPHPSIVVDSGHGTHLYWLLDQPAVFTTEEDRVGFQNVVAGVGKLIGGDKTHDLARLLRLPGTWNCKRFPWHMACVQDHHSPFGLHNLDKFKPHGLKPKPVRATGQYVPTATWAGLTDKQREAAEKAIERSAVAPPGTRSEVDYGTLVWLAKLGLSGDDAWERVQDAGKFSTDGERYFWRTWERAAGAAAEQRNRSPSVGLHASWFDEKFK